MNDVTERDAVDRLHACETLLRAAFDDALMSMGLIDSAGRWSRVNAALARMLQTPADTLRGQDALAFVHKDERATFSAAVQALHEGRATAIRIDLRLQGNRSEATCVSAHLARAGEDISLAVQETGTHRARDDQARFLAAVVASSEDAIVGKSLDGTILSWNRGAERLYGYTAPEVIGHSIHLLAPVEGRREIDDILTRIREGGQVEHYETERLRKDGRLINVALTVSPVRDESDRIIGASTIARDITRRVQAEVALQHTSEILEKLFASIRVMLAYLDRDFNFIKVNRAYAVADRRDPEFFVGKNHFALYPNAENEAIFRRVVETGETYVADEKPFEYAEHPERGVSYWDWVLQPILGSDGRVEGLVFSLQDVTDRVLARRRAEAAAAYTRSLIEASLDPLVTIGPDGRITDVNAATEAVTGLSRTILVGTDFCDYFTVPHQARLGYQQVFERGFVRDFPLEIRHRDGHTTPVLYNASVYRDETGNVIGVFAAARDVTERRRAEAEVRAAASYTRRLIEASLDPLVTIGADGRITDVNAATEQVTGRRRQHLIGSDFSDYFTQPEQALNGYRQVFEKGFVRDYPLDIRHADGHVTPVLYNASLYRDEANDVVGVFAAARDISERRRAELALRESEARYRSLFERMFDGYALHEIILDDQGQPCDYVFLEVNPAFERMLGLKRDQVIGRRVLEVLPDTEPEWIQLYGEVALSGKGRRFERYAREFDRYFEVVAYSPAPRMFASLFSDVTERRRAEKLLRNINQELEQRVTERTAALEASNRELESFAYSVSHDLRTPLRAIDGFSKILLMEYDTRLDDEGRRLLHIVRDNTDRMAQLISDILHFSRTGRAEMNPVLVDMHGLAREAWEEVSQTEANRTVECRIGELPPANGDRALLRQVWTNLIGNAVKFTRPRTPGVIEVGAEQHEDEIVYFVRDNGVGFDMRYVDRLFGVFQRLHSMDEFEGTGIGLAIVKRIVARHGGRVWAESTLGEGAVFYFTLPGAPT